MNINDFDEILSNIEINEIYPKTNLKRLQIHTFPCGESTVEVPTFCETDEILFYFFLTPNINSKLIQLILALDTLSEQDIKVSLLLPYLPYSRQNRRVRKEESLSIKTIMKIISNYAAVRSVTTIDIHDKKSLLYSSKPTKLISANKLFLNFLKNKNIKEEMVCIAPDSGASDLVTQLAQELNVSAIFGQKNRDDATVKVTFEKENIDGQKIYIIRDDMIDTGNTIVKAAEELFEMSAKKIMIMATHGVFSNPSKEFLHLLKKDEVSCIVTNTIKKHKKTPHEVTVLDFNNLFV